MPRTFTRAERQALWDAFFSERTGEYVLPVANRWPEVRAAIVDYTAIERANSELAEDLLLNPESALMAAEEVLRKHIPPDSVDAKKSAVVRVRNLPDTTNLNPGDVRVEHLNRLVKMPGRLKKIKDVQQKVKLAAFQCLRCGSITEIPVPDLEIQQPLECAESAGGCGRSRSKTAWRLLAASSDDPLLLASQWRDLQVLHLEEHYDPEAGHDPRVIRVMLWDDLVGIPYMSDVTVTGVVRVRSVRKGLTQMAVFETYVDAVYIEGDTTERSLEVTVEEEAQIRELAQLPADALMAKMVRSFCPTVYGMEDVKEAILLQLFGGVKKVKADGSTLRGTPHLLFIGSPGIAKTQLLRFAARVAPIGRYGSGEGSTGVGLTFAAEKDELDGLWSIKFGLLPLCHKGLAVVDEFDKMEDEDRNHLHTVLEHGELPYAKAGLSGVIRTEVSFLAGANPKDGVFDEATPLNDQIKFPSSLLSRFDIVAILEDKPDEERDRRVAAHIVQAHSDRDDIPELIPEIPPVFLRKYVAWARRHIVPRLTGQVHTLLVDKYVESRKQSGSSVFLHVTPRMIESLIRLSESSARARLSETVDEVDVKRVIRLYESLMRTVAYDPETGKIDMTVIATGHTRSQWDRMKVVRDTLRELGKGDGVTVDELVAHIAQNHGWEEGRVRADFETLLRRGEAYSAKKDGRYRLLD